MSKYDFQIDLSKNTSTGNILDKIEKGSVVLEFGCATGRMTRYMKENLDCQVYIVEYDKDAYEIAKKYAKDGLADDISTFRWAGKFKNIEFDVIIFADVLEHLKKPEKVLEVAAGLLKKSGAIYVSVPNITHNDIILKAFDERFDYTKTGILDDTHVHFWGLRNLMTLVGNSDLQIKQIEATYCPTGYTEQYEEKCSEKSILLKNLLNERMCGEVYQFIVTLYKGEKCDQICKISSPSIKSHLYLDTGKDFNSGEVIEFEAIFSGNASYNAHYVLENLQNVKRLRFDPVEGQSCILKKISVFQNGEQLLIGYSDAAEIEDGILLRGDDPMVFIDIPSEETPIVIDAEIIILGESYLYRVQEACFNKNSELVRITEEFRNAKEKMLGKIEVLHSENEQIKRTVIDLKNEKKQILENIQELRKEKEKLCVNVDELEKEKAELHINIDSLTKEKNEIREAAVRLNEERKHFAEECMQRALVIETMQGDLNSYILLVNNKDKYALALEKELNYYKSLEVVRMRAYIVRVKNKIKYWIKRLIGKEEH